MQFPIRLSKSEERICLRIESDRGFNPDGLSAREWFDEWKEVMSQQQMAILIGDTHQANVGNLLIKLGIRSPSARMRGRHRATGAHRELTPSMISNISERDLFAGFDREKGLYVALLRRARAGSTVAPARMKRLFGITYIKGDDYEPVAIMGTDGGRGFARGARSLGDR